MSGEAVAADKHAALVQTLRAARPTRDGTFGCMTSAQIADAIIAAGWTPPEPTP